MKAAKMPDGRLLCAILDMTLDDLDELPLVIRRDVKSIKYLRPDGEFESVGFTRNGDRYTLDVTAKIFEPLILVID